MAAGMEGASRAPEIIRLPLAPRYLARDVCAVSISPRQVGEPVRRHPALGSECPEVRAVGALWLGRGVDPQGVWRVCVCVCVCVCEREGGTQVEGVGVTQGGSSLGFMTNSDSGRATSFSVFSSLKGRRRNQLDPSSAGLQRL